MDNYSIYKSAAKARGFYDIPIWDENRPKPDYYDLFTWTCSNFISPTKAFSGSLNEELFDTMEKKIAYIKGVFEDESGSYLDKGYILFANSESKVNRVKKWINEISTAKKDIFILFSPIKEHNIRYSIPICHTITLHEAIIKYIKEYKL